MKTFTLTQFEYDTIHQALSCHNDMFQDMMWENVGGVDLFSQEPQIVTPEKAKQLRNEVDDVVDTAVQLRLLLLKFGIKVGKNGYSV